MNLVEFAYEHTTEIPQSQRDVDHLALNGLETAHVEDPIVWDYARFAEDD